MMGGLSAAIEPRLSSRIIRPVQSTSLIYSSKSNGIPLGIGCLGLPANGKRQSVCKLSSSTGKSLADSFDLDFQCSIRILMLVYSLYHVTAIASPSSTDMSKPGKIKRGGLSSTALSRVGLGEPTKLNHPGFLWMQFE